MVNCSAYTVAARVLNYTRNDPK